MLKKSLTFLLIFGNCEEQLTSTDCRPTDNQQFTDRLPTGCRQLAKILERKSTLLKPMSKPTKLNKSEEQLIVTPEVWINMENKPSSEVQALEKEVWIKM